MVSDEVLYLTVRELGDRIRRKQLSPVDLTAGYLARSEKYGPALNAYVTITRDLAMAQAKAAAAEIAAGHYRGPLHGIPYAAKDLLAVKGYPTTWGAKPYEHQTFDADATVIDRLNRAGAILVGKAAMIELAGGLGYSGPNASLTGPCHNPWDVTRWTSGSSSGSACIAAAGMAAFTLGSDTRGSIISPSTLCGVAGMRPSFGRVSRRGVMTIAWSMDKIGPLARSADCCGLVLQVIAGHDPGDFDSLPDAQSAFAFPAKPDGRRLRIGRLTNVSPQSTAEHAVVNDALAVMEKNGATVTDAALPDGPYEEAAELVILIEAASAFDELIDSGRCALLEDPLGQINGYASRQFSAHDLLQIERVRTKLQQKVDILFDQFDVLAAPGESSVASPLVRTSPGGGAGRGLRGAAAGRGPGGGRAATPGGGSPRPVSQQPDGVSSLCGLPAITVPCGFSPENLPMGIQFLGRALRDDLVVEAARQFQAKTDWHRRHPALTEA